PDSRRSRRYHPSGALPPVVPAPRLPEGTQMLRSAASLVLSAALLSSVSIAQTGPQNVGIYLSKNAVAISGVVCGFDCADPGNVVTVRAQVNDTIDVRVIGDLGQPAFLVVSLG